MRLVKLTSFFFLSLTASAQLRFTDKQHLLDLRKVNWQYSIGAAEQTASSVASITDWKPIRVGSRWNELGYPGLERKIVWLRLAFTVPSSMRGEKVGLFFSEVDDMADIYLNNQKAGSASYELGYAIPGPTQIDLTPYLRFDASNELLIQVRDKYVRSPGLLGNVLLYRTLPFTRLPGGGLEVSGASEPLSVLLHVGDALLARAGRTSFSAAELRKMEAPSYVLRDDELVVVARASDIASPPPHTVELDHVHPLRASGALSVKSAPLPAKVPLYHRLDVTPEVTGSWSNPFDPRQISVQAVILTPSRRVEKVPAFFWQDFRPVALNPEEEILLPVKNSPWRVTYRPRELGEYSVELFAQDRSGLVKFAAGKFTATSSSDPGYLRVSRTDPRFFEYSNGDSFFGIGPSGWYRGKNYVFGGNPRWVPAAMMDAYYERKAAAGSNYEYLGTFHYGRLLTAHAVMDQHIAWKLDRSLRKMERLGIRWLFFHDDIRRYYRYGVAALPYSKAQGGTVSSFNELYTEPTALDWQKNQLLYIVARLADSPSIWMWNIGDEWKDQPGNKFSVPLVRSWIKELHQYVRTIDVYEHPHAIGEGEEAILNGGDVLPIEGWYLNHAPHKNDDWRNGRKLNLVDEVLRQTQPWLERSFPVIDVEGGLYGWNGTVHNSGREWGYPEAMTFRQHLWLSLFLKSAAGGTEWLNNVLDADGNMKYAGALARFLQGESLTRTLWKRAPAPARGEHLQAWALVAPGRSLALVHNRSFNWLDQVTGRPGVPVRQAAVSVPVARGGAWTVEYWDTATGSITKTIRLNSSSGSVEVPLDEVGLDAALKLRSVH
ncbi:MAG: hypothetical protein JNL98_37640 [Bryobacterales bacterium]|nr:hypothetical protein [Bryobacterales bacterium]